MRIKTFANTPPFSSLNLIRSLFKKRQSRFDFAGHNLISGGVGYGKTTVLSFAVNQIMTANPDWKLIAIGTAGFLRWIAPAIQNDELHQTFPVYDYPPEKNKDAADRLIQAFQSSIRDNRPALIAVDEILHLLADQSQIAEFREVYREYISSEQTNVTFLMTFQVVDVLNGFFNFNFFGSFNNHLILRNHPQLKFTKFRISPEHIPTGTIIPLKNCRDAFVKLPNLEFIPGKTESNIFK